MNLLKTILPNQLVQNGNFESASNWTPNGATFSVSNGIATITPTGLYGEVAQPFSMISGHKYLVSYQMNRLSIGTDAYNLMVTFSEVSSIKLLLYPTVITGWQTVAGILNADATVTTMQFKCLAYSAGFSAQVKNVQAIDLTLLYGQGLEPSTVAQFRADYPLDYYPYSLTNTTGLLTCANGAITADISSMLPSGIGVVDLGSLNWVKASPQLHTFYANFPTTFTTSVVTYICENYTSIAPSFASDSNDKCVYGNRFALTEIIITDSDYDDAVMFKTAMAGKMLIYKTS